MIASPTQRSYPAEPMPLSALSHPEHVWLHDYWQARRAAGALPARWDIDPTEFPAKILPRLAIIAVEPGAVVQYRYRLAGTEIVSRAGRDPTGKTFEDLYQGDYLAGAHALYEELRQSAEPHFSQRLYPIGDNESFLRYDRLILPLAADGRTVDQFLLLIVVVEQGGFLYRDGSFARAGRPQKD